MATLVLLEAGDARAGVDCPQYIAAYGIRNNDPRLLNAALTIAERLKSLG